MWSVKNDDESLETAAVAAAREQMVTACSMWASLHTGVSPGAEDQADCMDLEGSAAAYGRVPGLCKTKA